MVIFLFFMAGNQKDKIFLNSYTHLLRYLSRTFKNFQFIWVRMSSKDLEELQTIAVEDGLPYQTLISSILHRYVAGRLIDKPRPNNKSLEADG